MKPATTRGAHQQSQVEELGRHPGRVMPGLVFCWCSAEAMASCGHPCVACQIRFGAQITAAMPDASQGHLVRSTPRRAG